MAFDIPGQTRSYEAGADLSSKQYTFVKKSGAQVVGAAAATDLVIGVLQNKPSAQGKAATVMISGVSKVIAAEQLAAGVPVYITSAGKVTSTKASNIVVGITETACSGADTVVSVLLSPLAAVSA